MTTTEQQLVPRANGGAVEAMDSPAVPGVEDFDAADFTLPRLRLVQAQSGFSEEQGKIHNSLTGLAREHMEIMVLAARKSRVRFPKEFNRDSEPLCASDDAIEARQFNVDGSPTGFTGIEIDGTPTTECAKCQYALWATDDKGKRVPPSCAGQITFLVADLDEGDLPALLTMKRMSMPAAKRLLTLVRSFGFRRSFRIGTEFTVNDSGKFYVYTVAAGEQQIPERLAHFVKLAEQYREATISADTEQDTGGQRQQRQGDTSFNPEELEG